MKVRTSSMEPKFTPHRNKHRSATLRPLYATGAALLVVLAGGCGDSNNDGWLPLDSGGQTRGKDSERLNRLLLGYPTLAEEAGLDQDDLDRLIKHAGHGQPISREAAETFVIGTMLDPQGSRYINRSMFDLGHIAKDGRLEIVLTGKATSTLSLESTKSASTRSDQNSEDFNGSLTGGGFFELQGAYHHEDRNQSANSDGTAAVKMTYLHHGAHIRMNVGDLKSTADFSQVLIGTPLTDSEIQRTVSYRTWWGNIIEVIAPPGGIDLDQPYPFIQLLSEMERIFGLLDKQYRNTSSSDLKNRTKALMRSLRSAISNSIDNFYAHFGRGFVSHVNLMSYGIGTGQLKFGQESGNNENSWSVAVNLKVRTPWAGGSAGTEIAHARSSGWASAFKNVHVETYANPATAVSVESWRKEITDMLQNEASKEVTVPPLSLNKPAKLTLPEPVAPKKDKKEGPPDTCFASYDDWKKYQADKKAEKDQDQKKARAEEKKIVDRGVGPDEAALFDPTAYDAYLAERAKLDALLAKQPQRIGASLAGDMRVEDMIVSGFEMADYADVIPQLRPNLAIPDEDKKHEGFPNISRILLTMDVLGRLDSYLKFMSQWRITGVTLDMSEKFSLFLKEFRETGMKFIRTQMINGVDLSDSMTNTFLLKMFGGTDDQSKSTSALYKSNPNIDVYEYIRGTLLKPGNMKIWREAPGGYLPFSSDGDQAERALVYPIRKRPIGDPRYRPFDWGVKRYYRPELNPLTALKEITDSKVTPWYPVFMYRPNKPAQLLFLQLAGPYQLLWAGRGDMIVPFRTSGEIPFDIANPLDPSARIDDRVVDVAASLLEGFTTGCDPHTDKRRFCPTWDYSLWFPGFENRPFGPELGEQFNVLTLQYGECSAIPERALNAWYEVRHEIVQNAPFTFSGRGGLAFYRGSGSTVDLNNLWWGHIDTCHGHPGWLFLLPINETSVGQTGIRESFRYISSEPVDSVMPYRAYDNFYETAIRH